MPHFVELESRPRKLFDGSLESMGGISNSNTRKNDSHLIHFVDLNTKTTSMKISRSAFGGLKASELSMWLSSCQVCLRQLLLCRESPEFLLVLAAFECSACIQQNTILHTFIDSNFR